MKPRNVIALDVGDRRIGVAITSLEAKLPRPLLTLDRQTNGDIFETISEIVKSNEAETVVVGLPRGLDGQETGQTMRARQFAKDLGEKLPDVKIDLQDEAGTSVKAAEELKTKGINNPRAEVDKLAACYILEDWLSNPV